MFNSIKQYFTPVSLILTILTIIGIMYAESTMIFWLLVIDGALLYLSETFTEQIPPFTSIFFVAMVVLFYAILFFVMPIPGLIVGIGLYIYRLFQYFSPK